MEPSIPKARTNKLWDIWNLRICILLSFLLQVFLLLFASMRQRSKRIWIQLLIWSIYLLADWIAVYGLGQAIQGPSDTYYDPQFEHYLKRELFVLWGQFFLLHLGGSDSMTSFSLVDSGSWLKQLAGLLLQFTLTFYSLSLLIFLRNFKLLLPTILVFLVGVIRCGERVNSLLAANFDSFGLLLPKPNHGLDRQEPGANQGSTAPESGDQVNSNNSVTVSLLSRTSGAKLNDSGLHAKASSNFKLFKVLFAGSSVSLKDQEESREFFLELDSGQAFRSIEFELIFLHDLLHTKAAMTQSTVGIVLRIICFFSVLGACIGFYLVEKHDYAKSDANITCFLFLGTVALEIISFIIGTTFWRTNDIQAFILKQKRWSRSVFQYDMLKYCLNKRQRRVLYSFAGSSDLVERYIDKLAALWSSSLVPVTGYLQECIFTRLKEKSMKASDPKQAHTAHSLKGKSVMTQPGDTSPNSEELRCNIKPEDPIPNSEELGCKINDFNYMESLLIWHLATTLYCQHYSSSSPERNICELLSNYMFYLLLSNPKMLDRDFGNWGIAFQDTQAAIQRFLTEEAISEHMVACTRLISKGPAQANGREGKSLLCNALRQLDNLINKQKSWKDIAKVWVELMCLAAIHCQPDIHAQQPSRGGELLTHVWLLINHLDLGTQFSSLKDGNAGTSGGNGLGENELTKTSGVRIREENEPAETSGGSGRDENEPAETSGVRIREET